MVQTLLLLNLPKITASYNIELSDHPLKYYFAGYFQAPNNFYYFLKKVLKAFLHYGTGAQI